MFDTINYISDEYFLQRSLENKDVNSEEYSFKPKKLDNLKVARLFLKADMKKQSRNIYYCSNDLVTDSNLKVKTISSCRTRLCPYCSWRKSVKTYSVVKKICQYLQGNIKGDYVFVTLTIKNVQSDELSSCIDSLLQAWHKFYRTKRISSSFDGSLRVLEITYNEQKNTYHPHLHVLFHTVNDYFSNQYITQRELVELWRDSLKVNYYPICHIEGFRSNNADELSKSIAEVSKYTVKYTDILNMKKNDAEKAEILKNLFLNLQGRRLLSFTGVLKKAKKYLELDEEDYTGVIDDDVNEIERQFKWVYTKQNYYEINDCTGGVGH